MHVSARLDLHVLLGRSRGEIYAGHAEDFGHRADQSSKDEQR